MNPPRSHALRKGRQSLPGHCYLVTIVTRNRRPWFRDPAIARIACRNLYAEVVSRHGETLAYVVMPDHLHWLLKLEDNLEDAVRVYKARVSLMAGEKLWQRGFHDHGIRREEDLRRVARYVVANPLRAGLVDDIRDYPYWNAVWL
ncbi:REP element-mobilizing transposase RayT [Halomonas campaniensis]|uniref:REP element-mobilizing transposase RayT n=1 Tax=Halomonas campaniensis TaxID=213554 RepID=A0A7W5K629_9GAMM|nr:transposase [Halomonas campaniensis]MBB3332654.1 REP element-mobilizing transposase RayT [Halomonas campaniensis]